MDFRDSDIFVPLDAPASQKRRWDSRIRPPPTNIHIGQLKLLATEIAFLYLGVPEDVLLSDCVIVYAGAAGGHHIPALAALCPETELYLYDPAPFAIQPTPMIHIINDIFTDEIAERWGKQREKRVLFICDIRTSGDTAEEHESEVESNMAMQAKWVELMQGSLLAFFLKFRISFKIIEANKPFNYLGGLLIYQAYPKPFSMELRLMGTAEDAALGSEAVEYNSRGLEETVFYHNTVIRPDLNRYANIFTGEAEDYLFNEFDHGFDCTYFLHVVYRYCQRFRPRCTESIVLGLVKRLITITSQGKWTLGQRKQQVKRPHA